MNKHAEDTTMGRQEPVVRKLTTYGKAACERPNSGLTDGKRQSCKTKDVAVSQPSGRGKRTHDFQSTHVGTTTASTQTKSELDNIYTLSSDGEDDVSLKKRRLMKVERTDAKGDGTKSSSLVFKRGAPHKPLKSLSKRQTSDASAAKHNSTSQRQSLSSLGSPTIDTRPETESRATSSTKRGTQRPTDRPYRHDTFMGRTTTPFKRGSPLLQPASSSAAPKGQAQAMDKDPQHGRVRLIDHLAAQAKEGSDSEPEGSQTTSETRSDFLPIASSDTLVTPKRGTEPTPRSASQTTQSVKRRKVKTYGQQRSVRGEGGSGLNVLGGIDELDPGLSQQALSPSVNMSKNDPFSLDEDLIEGDIRPRNGILGLHALRQAGANHRFANELGDLIECVGTPQPFGSPSARSRRTALLELGRKLQDKKFVSLFCDYGTKEALFHGIGAEEDPINGFVLMSAFLVLLAASSASHLIDQLKNDDVAQLVANLLKLEDDITSIARQKRNNLSKHGMASLEATKAAIFQLNVWGSESPGVLSPRTLVLKVLSVSCKAFRSASNGHIIVALIPALFAVVARGQELLDLGGCGEVQQATTNVAIALSLLQEHSVGALETQNGSQWQTKYLPLVASVVSAVLDSPSSTQVELLPHALKLAMNATNNASSAAILGREDLVSKLASGTFARFRQLQESADHEAFSTDAYENLVLLLGVLINITEHYPASRRYFGRTGRAVETFNQLIAVFWDNRDASSSADSYEQTSLAVAFGYLAILLGYLSLDAEVQRYLEDRNRGNPVRHILDAICEFMTFHEKVTDTGTDGMAASLQSLVNELQLRVRMVC